MMFSRLCIARNLLKQDGVLIVTIDDYELFGLLGLLENLNARFLGRVCICIKPEGRRQSKYMMEAHEYALFVTWGNPVILCTNNENNICTEVCYPRIKKVINGYQNGSSDIKGFGGNLKYFRTDFADAEPTDKNKKKLTEQAMEMLCMKVIRVLKDTHGISTENGKLAIWLSGEHINKEDVV
ncbi:MAG: hypothetical protein QY317_10750 [Candidatus Jettenia caeni]|nr:MAG: hypothetical protein QY317_10750 [Candidatus Jettenia caeni]